MKKKLILMLALVAIACLFTLSIGASPEKPDLGVSFGEVQEIPGFTPPSQRFVNTDERVVLFDGENYITYPSYYIVSDVTTFNDSFDFGPLKEATKKNFSLNSIILLEIPEGITGLAGWAVYECKNCIYVKAPSTVVTYSNDVFAETTWLKAVEFESGNTAVTMGSRMFYKSSSLKYIKLPNNLVTMGSDAFRLCTSLETLVLGASFENLTANGYNFAGPESTLTTDIYISTAFGSQGLNNNMFNWNSTATKDENARMIFHFTGTKDEAESLQAKALQTSNNGKLAYAIIVSKDDFVRAERDTTKNYIVYGYSSCETFYGGHAMSGNTTAQFNGFFESITFADVCTREGCGNAVVDESKTIDAVFTYVGYSYTEAPIGGSYSMSQFFRVNDDAMEAYKAYTGKGFEFGIVAASVENPFAQENYDELVAAGNIITESARIAHDYFGVRISGIPEGYTDKAVVFCAYVKDGDTVYYLDNEQTVTEITGKSYNQVIEIGTKEN